MRTILPRLAPALLLALSIHAGHAEVLPCGPANPLADTIYYNGSILTGNGLEDGTPERVYAIAIRKGVVLCTIADAGQVQTGNGSLSERLGLPATAEMVDLHGAFVMPGLNDAHVHLGEAGRIKLSVDLIGAASLADMLDRIKTAAAAAAPGAWLTGGGWDHTLWAEKVLPSRLDLDAVAAGHPAIFSRVDGHIAVVNSAALSAAGITRSTPDPQGGKIDHGADGEPTGILREDSAMTLVRSHVPPLTPEQRRRGLELAIADAVSHGLTSVQDNSEMEDLRIYEQMEAEGRLPIRITEWLPFNAPLDQLLQLRASHPANDRMLHTGMLKGFMDGSLGSRTAAMKAAYADDPGNTGLPRYDQATLNQMTIERARAGFQIGFHAIGDRAASMALDAFAAAEADPTRRHNDLILKGKTVDGKTVNSKLAHAPATARFRVEHAQVVDPADILRFKQLGVIASMQPNHLLTDMNWAQQRLGPERARYSYAWKAFLDAGVPLAFGTDYPVEPVTPFRGIYSAVTRQNEAGTMTFFPENKLNIGQALYEYTQGSAYADFAEGWKGRLLPGFAADFTVLDRDPTKIPAEEILKTQVLRTVVAGKAVYASSHSPQ